MFKKASKPNKITPEIIAEAAQTIGIRFTDDEMEMMTNGMGVNLESYEEIRAVPLANDIPPALFFHPEMGLPAKNETGSNPNNIPHIPPDEPLSRPTDLNELAFASLPQLAELLRRQEVQAIELTQLFLDRLRRLDPTLQCVITLTPERALAQAAQADQEIAAGNYRGMLHGIPWGAKDLLAVKGYPTSWGAAPFQEQQIDEDAWVVKKLDAAGAILVAKLTSGALAYGDIWYGGVTKNPWNIEEGSSGSSAGPGSAVAAGLVPFAIGSETLGSIVSPSTRCGITGLRPTFGRISRAGAMALSWSMDKLGPMARSAVDCGLVFAGIHGADSADPTSVTRPFDWDMGIDWRTYAIGYTQNDFESEENTNQDADLETIAVFKELGGQLTPLQLPALPFRAMILILAVEAAAAFDALTRSNQDDALQWQDEEAWPNTFRRTRFVPAVEYVQANRLRTQAMRQIAALLSEFDLYLAPSFAGNNLTLTNLTGNPAIVLPNGVTDGAPSHHSITLNGKLYGEAALLKVAGAYQQATDFHQRHPRLPANGAPSESPHPTE